MYDSTGKMCNETDEPYSPIISFTLASMLIEHLPVHFSMSVDGIMYTFKAGSEEYTYPNIVDTMVYALLDNLSVETDAENDGYSYIGKPNPSVNTREMEASEPHTIDREINQIMGSLGRKQYAKSSIKLILNDDRTFSIEGIAGEQMDLLYEIIMETEQSAMEISNLKDDKLQHLIQTTQLTYDDEDGMTVEELRNEQMETLISIEPWKQLVTDYDTGNYEKK